MRKQKPRSIMLPRSVRRLFPNVKFAVDADTAIHVSVNAKDCKDAEKLNPSECALARAAKRELKADGVIIGMGASYVIRGDKAVRYHTPESVQREIVSFDRHHDFAPGDYHLPPKSPAVRFGVEPRSKRPTVKGKPGDPKTMKHKLHTSARVRKLPHGASGEK
jgi:hypothetical protein